MKKPESISYSALSDYKHCTYYYKLTNIERLREFTKTVWTYHGSLMHTYVQLILQDILTPEEAINKFTRVWSKFCSLYKKSLQETFKSADVPLSWLKPSNIVFSEIKERFEKEFGKYEVLKVEDRIAEMSEDWPQEFRGYVDIIIKTDKGIVIIDFKNCNSAFMFMKYKDKYKDYQLTFYKHFICRRDNIDPKDAETYFVLFERSEKSKNPISMVRITSGNVKVNNALGWLNLGLAGINKEIFIKNRMACHKYGEKHMCPFYKSEHCK